MAHQNKDVRKAIQYAESLGWTYVAAIGKRHLKGELICPIADSGCRVAVYGTPQNPTQAAKRIRQRAAKCPHKKAGP
jgi:hypothetical protein